MAGVRLSEKLHPAGTTVERVAGLSPQIQPVVDIIEWKFPFVKLRWPQPAGARLDDKPSWINTLETIVVVMDPLPVPISVDEIMGNVDSLKEWKSAIERLISNYGESAKLRLDAGHNSISFDVIKD